LENLFKVKSYVRESCTKVKSEERKAKNKERRRNTMATPIFLAIAETNPPNNKSREYPNKDGNNAGDDPGYRPSSDTSSD
jgi:hypothetical protein